MRSRTPSPWVAVVTPHLVAMTRALFDHHLAALQRAPRKHQSARHRFAWSAVALAASLWFLRRRLLCPKSAGCRFQAK